MSISTHTSHAASDQPAPVTDSTWPEESVAAQPRLLAVDDEPYVLEGLKDTLRRSFNVTTTTDSAEALEMLRREPGSYAVVIADMRMPGMSGAEFLRQARMIAPYTVRMLLTGNSGLETAIKAVNGARLFRYLTKPCEPGELLRTCMAALGQHRLESSERVLLDQTVRAAIEALTEALALTCPAAYGRAARLKALAAPLARATELPNAWEVEVAAMLACIGSVILPAPTAERFYSGNALSDEEMDSVHRVPAATRRLLSRIPRLEGVLEILDLYETALPEGAEGYVCPAPAGALALRVASDFDQLLDEVNSQDVALSIMHRRGIYDRRLLDAFTVVVGNFPRTICEVGLADLRVGMRLEADVWTAGGRLLVARGQVVSEELLERLRNVSADSVPAPVLVAKGHV